MKTKLRFMLILIAIISLVATLSFATDIPVTTDGSEITISEDNTSQAQDETNGDLEFNEDDWISDDLYLIKSDKAEINKIIDGNAFIIANEVVISSEIGGDVFVMANKIVIEENAYIYSGLYAMAQEIQIDGIVCDAYIMANNFTLGDNGYIYRDLRLTANNVNVNGKIRRNAHIVGVNYNFNQENGALIGGDLYYSANQELSLSEDTVMGDVHFEKEEVKETSVGDRIKSYVFSALNALVYTLVIVLLILWLAPKFVEKISNMSTGKTIASVGVGIITPIIAIFAGLLLLVSGIASSLGIVLGLLLFAICISGTAFASIYFGNLFTKLLKWEGKLKLIIASVIAALIIWIISQIPFIGGVVGYIVASFGIGILVINILSKKDNNIKE